MKAIQAGIGQYVILGAGYDSFGLRRTDLKDQVIVFKLNQPATQQLKLNKLRQNKVAVPDNIRFVAGDLSERDMFELVLHNGFDRTKPAVFSWFGVT